MAASIQARAGDTLSFPTDHSRLNAFFESYKLAAPSLGDLAVTSSPLSTPFHLAELGQHSRLSYQQVADRAKHNHLKAGPGGELLCVDGKGQVVAVQVDPATAAIRTRALLQLPLPASSNPSAEYPDALPVAPLVWLVNDGQGSLYIMRVEKQSERWTASLGTAYRLNGENGESLPLRLLAVGVLEGTDEAVVLFSTASKSTAEPEASAPAPEPQSAGLAASTRLAHRSKTTFDFHLARISLSSSTGGESLQLTPLWKATSDELPAFVHYDAQLQRFAIGSGARVVLEQGGGAAGDDAMPIDGGSEGPMEQGDTETTTGGSAPGSRVPKPPPFSWTQDGDSVTVAFPIPSDTPTSSIRLTLSRQFVTLHIASAAAALAAGSDIANAALPRLSHKKLWDSIDPHTSVWTFDREAEGRNSTYGILTLHLEKANPGTRWSDVFESKAKQDDSQQQQQQASRIEEIDSEEEYEHVAETLDPSELAAISESMEKWSQSILQGGPSALSHSAEGLGSGIPTSLTGDEIDVEVDGDSGKAFVVTWIEDALSSSPRSICPHPTVPHSLLSTPFPSAENLGQASTIAVQHDVDGLLYRAPVSATDYRWTHESTFPALAFVLATKRDTRFVYHLDNQACFAFDAPALLPGPGRSRPTAGAGNAFVYVAPSTPRAKQGTQHVVKVGSPNSGALVGVVSTTLASGEPVIVALCERELVTLRLFA